MKNGLFILFILCISSLIAVAQKPLDESEKINREKASSKSLNSPKNDSDVEFKDFSMDEFDKTPLKDFSKYLNNGDKAENLDLEKNLTKKKSDKKPKPKEKEIVHKYEVSVNVTTESLSNNFGIWKTGSLFVKRKSEDGKILWGEYRVSQRRTNPIDREIVAGIYQPLKKGFAFTVETSYSDTNSFVAKHTIRAEGERVFKGGWVGHIGYWYKKYRPINVKVLYGEVEKYWGNNRLAYKLNFNNVSNTGTSPSNTITYNRYYGERINTFGIRLGFGREEEFVEPNLGILKTHTIGVTGSFKHWITKNIGIAVDATLHKQGDFYYRRGLNLGARYRF